MCKVQVLLILSALIYSKAEFKLSCDSSRSINLGKLPRIIDINNTIFELTSNKKIAKGDLKKIDLKSALEYHSKSITSWENRILSAGENIPRIVNIVNDYYKAEILELSNEAISINSDHLIALVEESAIGFLRRELKENVFVGYFIIKSVQEHLKRTRPFVKSVLDGKAISLSDIAIHSRKQNSKMRTCSLNIIQIFFQLIRLQIGKLFIPLQTVIIETFTSITDYIMTFYVESNSANSESSNTNSESDSSNTGSSDTNSESDSSNTGSSNTNTDSNSANAGSSSTNTDSNSSTTGSSNTNTVLTALTECTNTYVLKVATYVTSVKETVNKCFNYVIYGTTAGIA